MTAPLKEWLDDHRDSAELLPFAPFARTLAALRAVVELHTPKGYDDFCSECLADDPCPTIRAIEKEVLR